MAKVAQQKEMTEMMKVARFAAQGSFRAGDDEKWAAYQLLDSDGQLAWRLSEGHAEFCRLQRMDFHRVFDRPFARPIA